MKTKILYMVQKPGQWNGVPIGIDREVYDHLHEAQEAAREHSESEIYEIECREVKS